MSYDVIGIGLCAWDTTLLFERYPAQNQKVEVLESAACGGGPVPTALAIFSRLGGKAAFVGAVGDRQEGLKIRCDLERYGVDVSHMVMRPNRTSPKAYIWVDAPTGDRTVALDKGDAEGLQVDDLSLEMIKGIPLLLIDGRDAEACIAAAETCRAGGGQVLLDAGSPRVRSSELLKVTDHAIVSQDFLEGTYPGQSIDQALQSICSSGPHTAMVTLGEEGGRWLGTDGYGEYKAFGVKVKDTTGAGDAFHGAYIYGLKRGWDIARRCRLAAGVAAMICTGLGGRTAAPLYEEALAFLQQKERNQGANS